MKLELLQEYIFIALDIFGKKFDNIGESINNELEAWLTFLSVDKPEVILKLIETYPKFEPLYREVYEICRNTEKVMGMFSKELQELDENTVQYMIDEMQDQIDEMLDEIAEKALILREKDNQLKEKDKQIEQGIRLYLSLCQAQGVSREIAIKGLIQTYQLSEEQLEFYLEKYWDED